MNIKKLIATVVFALGAWMSTGAMAAAPSVTYLGNDIYAYNNGSTTMNYNITISNTDGFQESFSSTPWWGDGSVAQLFSAKAVNNAQGANFAYSYSSLPGGEPFFEEVMILNIFYSGSFGYNYPGDTNPYAVATLVSSGGAVPEMNASLIPQVGFLLACLFFMFGRKKETAEPMLVT